MSVDHDLHLPNLKGTVLCKPLLEMRIKFLKRNKVKAIMNRRLIFVETKLFKKCVTIQERENEIIIIIIIKGNFKTSVQMSKI
jgi:hypothetical protein